MTVTPCLLVAPKIRIGFLAIWRCPVAQRLIRIELKCCYSEVEVKVL